jgi:hypothetical protein
MRLLQGDQRLRFRPAVRAPGGPEVDDEGFSAEILQGVGLPVDIAELEVGRLRPFLQQIRGVGGVKVFRGLRSLCGKGCPGDKEQGGEQDGDSFHGLHFFSAR